MDNPVSCFKGKMYVMLFGALKGMWLGQKKESREKGCHCNESGGELSTSTFKYAENSTTSKTSFCFRLCVYMYSSQEPLLQRE